MNQSAPLSEGVVDLDSLSSAPPKILQGMKPVPARERQQPVPKLSAPKSSQIAAAVINARPAMSRKEIASFLPSPMKEVVLLVGEVDPLAKGQKALNIEFYKCLTVITAINYARHPMGINPDELIKAEGAESAHFMHFSEKAGVDIIP